jgi:hypothetical protein
VEARTLFPVDKASDRYLAGEDQEPRISSWDMQNCMCSQSPCAIMQQSKHLHPSPTLPAGRSHV